MKKTFFTAAVLTTLFTATYTKAQIFSGDMNRRPDSTLPKGEFGVMAGANMQSISGKQWATGSSTGLLGGFWARMHKDMVGFKIEVLMSSYRLKSADSNGVYYFSDSLGTHGDFRATALNIPVMFELTFAKRVTVQLGGQYSNLISVKNMNSLLGDYKLVFNPSEFSAIGGVEVVLPANFSVGARYRLGFSDINNPDVSFFEDKWQTSAIQIFATYKIK